MDAARLGSGQPTIKLPDMDVVDLSEEDSDVEDALLTAYPRVNGVNGTPDLDALDAYEGEEQDSDDYSDVESLFEDTIEEMGDEHLFDGGEYLATPY